MQTACLFILLVMGEGTTSMTVITPPEINATLGTNIPIILNCTFLKDTTISIVSMAWSKKIGDAYTSLAQFKPSPALNLRFTDNGTYLINRSELTSHENGSTNFILTINDIECRDDGKYQCWIWYLKKDDYVPIRITGDTTVSLQVDASKPSNFTLYPNNTLRENDNVTLSCTANVGNPEGYIAMWKNGKLENVPTLLNKSNSVEEKGENCSTNTHLTVNYTVSRKDDGAFFSCSSQNRQTQKPVPQRTTDEVTVLYAPSDVKIDISPTNSKVFTGTTVHLTCYSDGNPIPTFNWMFNSSYDGNDGMRILKLNNETLTLKNVNLSYSGIYTCVAWNSIYGEKLNKSSEITLEVEKREQVTMSQSTCGEHQCGFTESCIVEKYKSLCVTNIWTFIALTFILLSLIFGMTTVILYMRRRTKLRNKSSININDEYGDRVQSQNNDYDINGGYSDPKDITKLCPTTEKSDTDNTAYADPIDANNQYASVQKTESASNPPNVYDGAWV